MKVCPLACALSWLSNRLSAWKNLPFLNGSDMQLKIHIRRKRSLILCSPLLFRIIAMMAQYLWEKCLFLTQNVVTLLYIAHKDGKCS